MVTYILVSFGSGHGRLPDDTEAFPERMSTHNQLSYLTFTWTNISILKRGPGRDKLTLHIMTHILVKISSGSGWLPDNTKPLPEAVLPYHQRNSKPFTWEQFTVSKFSWTWVSRLHFWNHSNISQGRIAGLILGLCPANERRHHFVTTSLNGWAQA